MCKRYIKEVNNRSIKLPIILLHQYVVGCMGSVYNIRSLRSFFTDMPIQPNLTTCRNEYV